MRFLSMALQGIPLAALLAVTATQGAVAQAAPGEPPVILFNWPDEDREEGKSYVFSGMSFFSTSDGRHGSAAFFGAGTEIEIGDNVRIKVEFVTGAGDRMAF